MIDIHMDCPTDSELLRYLDETRIPDASDEVLKHLEGCPRCVDRLALAAGDPAARHSDSIAQPSLPTIRVANPGLPESIGPYPVLRRISQGGMSEVFECVRPQFGQRVAVKRLLEHRLNGEMALRFEREARLHARLSHPGIVTLYEFGEADSMPYLVVELVRGESLAHWLKESPLPSRIAAEMTVVLAETLEYAHRNGVIHRDLKPGNIVIPDQHTDLDDYETTRPDFRHPRIIDFGLSRMLGETSDLTSPSRIVGTPAYIAPERIQQNHAEEYPASDIYSLGVILYESLVGRKPFYAEDPVLTLQQIRTREPVPPRMLAAGLARDLETICLKCLEKNPAARYRTARELADDLIRFLEGRTIHARPVGLAGRFRRWCGRNPGLAASLAFSALLFVGMAIGGVWFALRESQLRFDAQQATIQARASESRAIGDRDQSRRLVREITTGLWEPLRVLTFDLAQLGDPRVEAVRKSVSDTFQAIAGQVTGPAFTTEIDPEERIRLQYRLGMIIVNNGDKVAADIAFRKVLAEFRELPSDRITPEIAVHAINAANSLAFDLITNGKPDEARDVWVENCNRWLAADPALVNRLHMAVGPLDVLIQNYRIYLHNHGRREESEALVTKYEALRARIPGEKQPFPDLD